MSRAQGQLLLSSVQPVQRRASRKKIRIKLESTLIRGLGFCGMIESV